MLVGADFTDLAKLTVIETEELLLGNGTQNRGTEHLTLDLAEAGLLDRAQDIECSAVVGGTVGGDVRGGLGSGFLVGKSHGGDDTHLGLVLRTEGVEQGALERVELQILTHGLQSQEDGNGSGTVGGGRIVGGMGAGRAEECHRKECCEEGYAFHGKGRS